MGCKTCSDLQDPVTVDVLAKESLPACVESFEDFGYYGDDLDSVHLLKCPHCGAYFAEHDYDHFEEGGAVGVNIKRVGNPEAASILEKAIEKVRNTEWLQSRYDLAKLKKELEILEKE